MAEPRGVNQRAESQCDCDDEPREAVAEFKQRHGLLQYMLVEITLALAGTVGKQKSRRKTTCVRKDGGVGFGCWP